jgi:hypothetical protein
MLRNYRVAAQLVASRVVLSSTELVSYDAKVVGRELNIFANGAVSMCDILKIVNIIAFILIIIIITTTIIISTINLVCIIIIIILL